MFRFFVVLGVSVLAITACGQTDSVDGDRAALVALYNATDGDNWKDNTNWLSDKPLGEWVGVGTNAQGRVDSLNLGDNQLSGPIPSELGKLSSLENLGLMGNQLSGPIPSELGKLSSLENLGLGSNQLSGPIPETIGNLANLEELYLSNNQLSGPIPLTFQNLTNLDFFGVDYTVCLPYGPNIQEWSADSSVQHTLSRLFVCSDEKERAALVALYNAFRTWEIVQLSGPMLKGLGLGSNQQSVVGAYSVIVGQSV